MKLLLSKKGYHSEDWGWLEAYGKKQASKLIDKLLNDNEWSAEFIFGLPAPVERKRRQAFLPLPEPEPMLTPLPARLPISLGDVALPNERARFKRWARNVFERGEQTIDQLGRLFDARFGSWAEGP